LDFPVKVWRVARINAGDANRRGAGSACREAAPAGKLR